MTKDILLKLSGLQFDSESEDNIEVITIGSYYFKNGKHYILYDEVSEDFPEITHNVIKVSPGVIEINKKGLSNVQMVFEEKKENIAYYETPFGTLLIGIHAKQIEIKESIDQLEVKIEYSLDINYEHVSDCKITMQVSSKGKAEIRL